MKKIIAAVIITSILSFAEVTPFIADNSPEISDIPVSASDERSEAETEEADSFSVGIEIVTPYYSVTVPDTWLGSCILKTVDNSTGKWVELFRTGDFGMEHLFSILLTDKEDYKMIADHDLIGELTVPDGTIYHVVVSYPTDVQFSREEADSYLEMAREAENILNSIQAAEGCTYECLEQQN